MGPASKTDSGTYLGKMEPVTYRLGTLLDLRVSFLCRSHTNFLCIGLYRSFQVYRMARWRKNHRRCGFGGFDSNEIRNSKLGRLAPGGREPILPFELRLFFEFRKQNGL